MQIINWIMSNCNEQSNILMKRHSNHVLKMADIDSFLEIINDNQKRACLLCM